MLREIQVYLQYDIEPPFPFLACKGIVTFDHIEELRTVKKFDRFIYRVIKTHNKWFHLTRHSEDVFIKDLDQSHMA
jgi:hypothetical protein